MTLNVKLLRKVRDKILAEPAQFEMDHWFTRRTNHKIPNCGTAACIAGWAISISSKLKPSEAHENPKFVRISDMAANLLGIETAHQYHWKLFSVMYWPDKYRFAWDKAKSLKQKARVAAKRIDAYIKEHEKP